MKHAQTELETGLSPRYFIAEASIWLLGGVLTVSRFFGLAPDQALPVLNVTLGRSEHFPRVIAALLVAAVLYMIVEWKQSLPTRRDMSWHVIRLHATGLWAAASLWFSYPVIAQNTEYAGISPAWYFSFLAVGVLLGFFASDLVVAALVIRSPEESKRLQLPRIPVASCAQFFIWIPVIVFLMIAYYLLISLSPLLIRSVAVVLVVIPFALMIGGQVASLCLARDYNGKRIPYAKMIALFKEQQDARDYACFLFFHGDQVAKEHGICTTGSPKQIQDSIRLTFAAPKDSDPSRYCVQLSAGTQIGFCPKDRNSETHAPQNRAFKVVQPWMKHGLLRVSVTPENHNSESREMDLPSTLVEAYAEEYLSAHAEPPEQILEKVLIHALNEAITKVLLLEAEPLLQTAAIAGRADAIRELLQQDVDVNEKGQFGWTALLAASAQGYPEIVRLLLEAGANPDIGNVHLRTPLMYAARYGNEDSCEILLEYGAALNLREVYGSTALVFATNYGHQSIVELLIKAGADPTVKTCEGMTALDVAYACKQGRIGKLLKQASKSYEHR